MYRWIRPQYGRSVPLPIGSVLICLIVTGCATPSVTSHYADISRDVQERSGQSVTWSEPPTVANLPAVAIDPYLRQPLTVSTAARIALVNNRELLATLRETDISRAALVQSMLPANPVLWMRTRYPIDYVIDDSNSEFNITKDLMDLFTWRIRKRMATHQLEQTKYRVGATALTLIHQVRETYYTLQGQMQVRDRYRAYVEATDAAVNQSRRPGPASGMAEADRLSAEASLAQSRSQLTMMERAVHREREKLNILMGLTGAQAEAWTIAGTLPPLPAAEPSLDQLEAQGLERRLDLAAARQQTDTLKEQLNFQRRTRFTKFFNFGIDYERGLGGEPRLWGPFASFELPIFDWGRARIADAKARLEQNQLQVGALETAVRSEVRDACDQLLAMRRNVELYQNEILPRRQREVELLGQSAGEAAAGRLAEARKNAAQAEQEAIDALRDYWVARAQLAQVSGGGVAAGPMELATAP